MDNWEIAKPAGICTVTGKPLEEGEEFYAVIFEEGETLRRADYSLAGWTGPPEGCFCHFRTRMPVKAKKKRVWVDNEVLISFFHRLAEETDSAKVNFRFVLALMLMRKRLLKYEDSVRDDEGREYWQMRMGRAPNAKLAEGGVDAGANTRVDRTVYRVLNPQLKEDEIQQVTQQLSAILYGQQDLEGVLTDNGTT